MNAHNEAHRRQAYWRTNLAIMGGLMFIWASVSYGASIVFVEQLNTVNLPGTAFPLGFWFAQQGSIYVFVLIIGVYVALMNRLDKQYGLDG